MTNLASTYLAPALDDDEEERELLTRAPQVITPEAPEVPEVPAPPEPEPVAARRPRAREAARPQASRQEPPDKELATAQQEAESRRRKAVIGEALSDIIGGLTRTRSSPDFWRARQEDANAPVRELLQRRQAALEATQARQAQDRAQREADAHDPDSAINRRFRAALPDWIPENLRGTLTVADYEGAGGSLVSMLAQQKQRADALAAEERQQTAQREFLRDEREGREAHQLALLQAQRRGRRGGGGGAGARSRDEMRAAAEQIARERFPNNPAAQTAFVSSYLRSSPAQQLRELRPPGQATPTQEARRSGAVNSAIRQYTQYADRSGLAELGTSLAEVDRRIGIDRTDEVEGFGGVAGILPQKGRDLLLSRRANANRQAVAAVRNAILRARSGGAITPTEADRLLEEIGEGTFKTDEQIRRGLANVRRIWQNRVRNLQTGLDPEILDEYRRRGGTVQVPSPAQQARAPAGERRSQERAAPSQPRAQSSEVIVTNGTLTKRIPRSRIADLPSGWRVVK